MWTYSGFRSRESHGLRCYLGVAWWAALCAALPYWGTTFHVGLEIPPSFQQLWYEQATSFSGRDLDSCSCFITHSISLSFDKKPALLAFLTLLNLIGPTRVLGMYYNPQHQLWLLFWGWGFFWGKYFLCSLTACQFKIRAAATLEGVSRGCLVLQQEQPAGEACSGGGEDIPLSAPWKWLLKIHESCLATVVIHLPECSREVSSRGVHAANMQLVHPWVWTGTPLCV